MTRRVALVGLGYFSQFHIAGWQDQNDVEICAVADLDMARAQSVAASLGASAYDDVEKLIATHSPEIVDIVAPPPAHHALISACLTAGRTIICQKPFCTSLEEARATIELADARGARLIIHENFRFQPWYREIKDFLVSGLMGAVYQARFALRPGDGRGPSAYMERQPAFQTMPRLLIHETGVHFIDLFQWLFGPIKSVYADLRQLNPVLAGEDDGVLLLNHDSGVRSVFDGNRLSDHVADNSRLTMGLFTIEGEAGTLALDGFGGIHFRAFGSSEERPVPVTRSVDPTSFGGGCTQALIAHVVAALDGNVPFENEARDYFRVAQASAAAYQSAAAGKRMDL